MTLGCNTVSISWCATTDRPNEKSWIAFVSFKNNADTQQFPDTGQSIQKLFTTPSPTFLVPFVEFQLLGGFRRLHLKNWKSFIML